MARSENDLNKGALAMKASTKLTLPAVCAALTAEEAAAASGGGMIEQTASAFVSAAALYFGGFALMISGKLLGDNPVGNTLVGIGGLANGAVALAAEFVGDIFKGVVSGIGDTVGVLFVQLLE